jgi:hypothetical protein
MWARVLAALGVGVWCLFVLFVSVAFVIDRGLADVGIVWVAVLGIGVVAPAIFMRQVNHAIALHEERKRAVPGAGEKEQELLIALEERGELTPATAAMRTSLTVEEAAIMLDRLASEGHLKILGHEEVLAYALPDRGKREELGPTRKALSSSPDAEDSPNGEPEATPEPLAEPLSERELEVLSSSPPAARTRRSPETSLSPWAPSRPTPTTSTASSGCETAPRRSPEPATSNFSSRSARPEFPRTNRE